MISKKTLAILALVLIAMVVVGVALQSSIPTPVKASAGEGGDTGKVTFTVVGGETAKDSTTGTVAFRVV